jgi:replicative DNA helicase
MSEVFDRQYFEKVICYNVFNKPTYLAAIADLINPDYFENEDVKVILPKIIDFFNRSKTQQPPNLSELRACFANEEDAKKLTSFLLFYKEQNGVVYDESELYRKTEIFLREKAVFKAVLKTTENISKGILDTGQVLDTFSEACNISLVDTLGFNYFRDVDIHIKNLCEPKNYLPSGWSFLDKKLNGGFLAKGRALYAFVGGTNSGKSIFLGNLAINFLKQGKTVLLITLEMPEELYAQRITTNITQINFNTLSSRSKDLKDLIVKYGNECKGTLVIKEFPTKGVTVNHINAYIKKLIQSGTKPDVLIVDYINLINGSKKYSGTYDEIKDVAEKLRATTYIYEIPCITASQLNRKGMGDENPALDTTSESIGLPFTLDGQFSIWSLPENRAQKIINLGIQKNRYGENFGQTVLTIDYDTLTLKETNQENTMSNDSVISIEGTLEAMQGKQYAK